MRVKSVLFVVVCVATYFDKLVTRIKLLIVISFAPDQKRLWSKPFLTGYRKYQFNFGRAVISKSFSIVFEFDHMCVLYDITLFAHNHLLGKTKV